MSDQTVELQTLLVELHGVTEELGGYHFPGRDGAEKADQSARYYGMVQRFHETTPDAIRRALAEASATGYGALRDRFRQLAFRLIDFYLQCDPSTRRVIWDYWSGHRVSGTFFVSLIDEHMWLIRSSADRDLLLKLMALFSVIDQGRGVGMSGTFGLSNLYARAEACGLDFFATLRQVAELSNDEVRPDETVDENVSTKEYLSTFEPLRRWS